MYDPSLLTEAGAGAAAATCRPVTSISLCKLNWSSDRLLLPPPPLLEASSVTPAAGSKLSGVPDIPLG